MKKKNGLVLKGVVVKKQDKMLTVKISSVKRHPMYKKIIKSDKLYHVHNPKNDAEISDTVLIKQCRKISKTKYFMFEKIVKKIGK